MRCHSKSSCDIRCSHVLLSCGRGGVPPPVIKINVIKKKREAKRLPYGFENDFAFVRIEFIKKTGGETPPVKLFYKEKQYEEKYQVVVFFAVG